VVVHANYRSVTDLTVDAEGRIWAGTSGGLVQWRGEEVRLWTRADGVPGLRIRRVEAGFGGVTVLADGAARLESGRFVACSPGPARRQFDSPAGLPARPIGQSKVGKEIVYAIPLSGLWTIRSGKPVPVGEPLPAKSITAIAADRSGNLVIGTAGRGVWRRREGRWEALPLPKSGLVGPDATALVPIGNDLWIAPRQGAPYRLEGPSASASGAPWRSSASWNGKTLVRQADGRLVEIGPAGDEKPAGLVLPRVNANSIAVEGDRLFVAQHGGWSEFPATGEPVHRFDVPGLAGMPTTVVFADARRVLIGTQSNGFVALDRQSGTLQHVHEAHGLTDDWITAIAPDGAGGYLVGTFVGGLLRWDGTRCVPVGLEGGCVTRLLVDGDQVWVGSLQGVRLWREGRLVVPPWADQVEPDVSDLATTPSRLWIAAGGALFEVRR
jgi:ligand-binding sensor domain-containing protein